MADEPSFSLSYLDENGEQQSEPISADAVETIIMLAEGLPDPNYVDDWEDNERDV